MRLAQKHALVTGGTGGIGREVVIRLVGEGAEVVFCGRNVEAGRALERETGGKARFIRADVTREADVTELVRWTTDQLGAIDCLFNNAAEANSAAFLDASSREIADSVASVFVSVVHVTQEVARVMIDQRGGVILQNGSSAAHRGNSSPAIYSSLKAAVCHLTRCLAMEFAPHGIRVNSISPGAVVTPIFQDLYGLGDLSREEALRRISHVLARLSPSGRAGTAADVAAAVVFLFSDEAAYITGVDLRVDGGLTAGLTPHLREIQNSAIKAAI